MEMHLFKKSISFIAVMCVFSAAYAAISAPSRVGVISKNSGSSRRLPSLSNISKSYIRYSTSSTSSTGSGLLSDAECIDDYRECMKSDSACGAGFENCTTNVLFHGHMAECYSTLTKCSASAIIDLMGTSNLSALSTVDSYVVDTNDTEVARYTYPTDGSLMGMDIIGAATRNKLSTADCVKKYKRCLNKDSVCGEDFELCTSDDEFKKQAVLCDSTLARCQKEGFQQIFGSAITTKPANQRLRPNADGDAHRWIEDGATLAAANAVNTCYKVVDNCFLSACAKNPYNCVEGTDWSVLSAADLVADANAGNVTFTSIDDTDDSFTVKSPTSVSDVRKFFRAACEETIGSNKYCQMTFLGRMPTKLELKGEDVTELYEEVFDDAYATRSNQNILGEKVGDLIKNFDKSASEKCISTFKTCAVNSCGGGSGAACYARVFRNSYNVGNGIVQINNDKTINNSNVYNDIAQGCRSYVNTDVNCRYMASVQSPGTYIFYNMTNSNGGNTSTAFDVLFPEYQAGVNSTSVVDALNADLSTAYNDVAIEGMQRQCQNLVENCVKSMCGKDFQNCYRNRNDVSMNVYNSGNSDYDNSMNKMGGVLDYTVIQGLCSSTIRGAEACRESLAIAKLGVTNLYNTNTTGTWGNVNSGTTITNAWRQSASMVTSDGLVNDVDANGHRLCECANGGIDICADVSGATDITCTTPHRVTVTSLMENQAVATLFQDVLALVEQEAQANYKSKLIKEQRACLAENKASSAGGLDSDNAPFVWAKLKNNLPTNYSTNGLGDNSVASNDLYDSFCRVRVDLKLVDSGVYRTGNDDGMNNYEKIGINSVAYFAAGDAIRCGSWLSEKDISTIVNKVGTQARKDAGEGSKHDMNVKVWTSLASTLVGGAGTYMLSNQSHKGNLGGFLSSKADESKIVAACKRRVSDAQTSANKDTDRVSANTAALARSAFSSVEKLDSDYKIDDCKTDGNLTNCKNSLSAVERYCTNYSTDNKDSNLVKDLVWAGIGGLGTGAITWMAIQSGQKSKYESAQNEAEKEFLKELNDKIRCFIGGRDVVGFGDVFAPQITVD